MAKMTSEQGFAAGTVIDGLLMSDLICSVTESSLTCGVNSCLEQHDQQNIGHPGRLKPVLSPWLHTNGWLAMLRVIIIGAMTVRLFPCGPDLVGLRLRRPLFFMKCSLMVVI